MSQMRMFVIARNGDLREFATFGNAHLGWAYMWDWFEHVYYPIPPGRFSMFIDEVFHPDETKEKLRAFWNLAREASVPVHRRIALRCSYQGAMARRESFSEIAAALRQVATEMEAVPWRDTSFSWEPKKIVAGSGHLRAIAGKIDDASKLEKVIGCCWQYSTCDSDPWCEGRITHGRRSRPFNIFTDKNPPALQWWINPSCLEGDDELSMKEKLLSIFKR